ncbi:MAG: helix-turn-helix domain-containing protein [Burkholderiaceae bacterium]|nr:helix-turn-helix domain-containing protein [Burkholderiaceae bacterium]
MSATSQTDPNVDPGPAAGAGEAPSGRAGTAAGEGGTDASAAAATVGTPGELAALREQRGWTVADLASKLGMAPRQIEAIERGDWDALPGQAFVRGAIRACGKALQADVGPLIGSVGGAVQPAELRPTATLDAPLPRHGTLGFDNGGSGSRLTWILLAILGVIAIAMYFGRGGEWPGVLEDGRTGAAPGRSVEKTVPLQPAPAPGASGSSGASGNSGASGSSGASGESGVRGGGASAGAGAGPGPGAAVPDSLPGTPAPGAAAPASPPARAPVGASSQPAAMQPGGAPRSADGVLRFRFEHESWVEVRDAAGKLLLHGLQPQGSERRVAGTRPYSLRVGNAAHVQLEYEGRRIDVGAIARQGVARLKLD